MAILVPSSKLNSFLNQKIFAQGELISLQQNILWRIDNGVVRTVTYTQSGAPIVLGYWGANDVVGQPLSRIMPYRIECLTSVKVTMLPQHMWGQAIDSLILHIQQADEFFELTSKKPAYSRLWHLLVWLGQKFGRDVDAGRLIDLRLTQQDLSEVASCARVTVTHLMQQFEQEGKLQRHKKRLILLT